MIAGFAGMIAGFAGMIAELKEITRSFCLSAAYKYIYIYIYTYIHIYIILHTPHSIT